MLWLVALAAGIVLLLSMAAHAASSFSDVPADHLFYTEITQLADSGIISGYPDGTFRPDAQVTRQQMAKIIVLAMDKHTEATDNQDDPTFGDVTPDMGIPYPFDYIEEAAAAGYFKGDAAGMFMPSQPITRVQLALILVRAGGDALAAPPAGYETGFTDVPDYGAAEVAVAKYNGILDGKTVTSFDPYSAATRGQVCKMVSRLLAKTAKGAVVGASTEPSADFQAIAARLNSVLALGYNTTNPDALAKVLLDKNPANDPVIIDTREPLDFAKGHIPGAVNIPLKSLPAALLNADPRIPMDKEIVTASYWGDDGDFSVLLINAYRILDPVAQKAAIDAKTTPPYPKCTTVFQGMTAWSFDRELTPAGTRFEDALTSGVRVQKATEAGTVQGVDQGAYPAYRAFGTDDLITKILLRANNYFGSFPTQFDLLIYPSALAQNLEDGNDANNPQIISVRSTADYTQAHIPGAINIPYQKVADVANFTKFVNASGPVVAYCYTGHTGGLATMALGILGYPVRDLLYGLNGWSTTAPTSGQLNNFDLMRGWDFPVNNGSAGDLASLGDYVPPAGCESCHTSLTAVFYDREVANTPAAATAPPSEGEG
jgi:rhodanese-related sulfurtransferase